MAAFDTDVFKSKPFTILVGEARTPFMVHAGAIARQSPALDTLVNGDMEEAQSGRVVFEDVREETFMRFCQFAYSGNYETPDFILEPVLEPSSPDVNKLRVKKGEDVSWWTEVPAASATINLWANLPESSERKSKKIPRKKGGEPHSRELKNEFNQMKYEIETPVTEFLDRCQVRGNETSTEDYTPVLLGHAQLYVFGEKWGIASLKSLCLYKLHQTLVAYTPFERRLDDIVQLAQYAYADSNTPDTCNGKDALRDLVMRFVTGEVRGLIQTPGFKLLLEQNGVFGRDLVSMMLETDDSMVWRERDV